MGNSNNKVSNPHLSISCTKEALEMIILIAKTILFMKYKYYFRPTNCQNNFGNISNYSRNRYFLLSNVYEDKSIL